MEEVRKSKHRTKWPAWAKAVFTFEAGLILLEGFCSLGRVIRGYPSFGGESAVVIIAAAVGVWWLGRK